MANIFDDLELQQEADKIDDLAAQLPEEMPLEPQYIEAVPAEAPLAHAQYIGQPTAINPAAVNGVPGVPGFVEQNLVNPGGVFTPVANQIMTSYDPMLDPKTGGAKAEGTITPIEGGALIVPEGRAATVKTGEESTTEYARSPQLEKRISEIDKEKAAAAKQSEKVLSEIDAIKEDKAKLYQIRADEGQKIAAESQRLYNQAEAERQYYRDEIMAKRQELASMKPESFWGSKSGADKIMLALSVGLGAWGQAEIGGANIGFELLKRNMDEHDSLQKQRFNQVEKELTLLQNYSVDSQRVINNQFTSLKALELAQKDKLDATLGALESRSKTESARMKIIEARTRLQTEITQKQAELEKDLLPRTVNTRFITDKVGIPDARAPYQFDGTPMDVDQRKRHQVVLVGGDAEHEMAQLEDKAQITKTEAYAEYYKTKQRHLELFASGKMGNELYSSAKALMDADPELRAILAANPDLQTYDRALNQYNEEVLRGKTGAAIAANEEGNLMRVVIPRPSKDNLSVEGKQADLDASRRARRRYLTSNRDISNSGIGFYFEQGKK